MGAVCAKCSRATEQLAEDSSSWDNNKRVEEARRARVEWLKRLQSECATEEELETTRTQPIFTQVQSRACSSSCPACPPHGHSPAGLRRISEENRPHFKFLERNERKELADDPPARLRQTRFVTPGSCQDRSQSCRTKELSQFGSSQFYRNFHSTLKAGQKIGGGAQADIHEVIYHGKVLSWCVLKVFQSDCLLEDLQRTWTNNIANLFTGFEIYGTVEKNCCGIKHGILLEDGRFAFILQRCWGDLRKAIDLQIVNDGMCKYPPFREWNAINTLRGIARGMANLHENNILHRGLKAANCLLLKDPRKELPWSNTCLVADFECSKGVVGTGFWRAPEVLLVLKNQERDINSIEEVWTKKTDVYSYAMTCYEVLTGCVPFQDRAPNDYDGVIGGERPPMPDYVNPKIQELVRKCWHSNPSMRPSFKKIVMALW